MAANPPRLPVIDVSRIIVLPNGFLDRAVFCAYCGRARPSTGAASCAGCGASEVTP